MDSSKPLYKLTKVVWYILSVIEVILLARFILLFLGANPKSPFVSFVNFISQPLAGFFENVFTTIKIASINFDINIFLAMAVYWLIAWGIVRLLLIGRSVSKPEAEQELRAEDKYFERK